MAMKKCKECGADVSSSAKKCPKCGKKLKHTGLYIFLGIIAFIILIVAVSGGGSSVPEEKFTLLDGSKGYYDGTISYYIEGSIKNNTDKKYSYVQVTFILYDKDGNQLGTAMDNANDIEPNATWKFKAMDMTGYASQVASYKLSEITGW